MSLRDFIPFEEISDKSTNDGVLTNEIITEEHEEKHSMIDGEDVVTRTRTNFDQETIEYVLDNCNVKTKEEIAEEKNLKPSQVARIVNQAKKQITSSYELGQITEDLYNSAIEKLTFPKVKKERKSKTATTIETAALSFIDKLKNS